MFKKNEKPFSKGQKVHVTDLGHVYTCYSQFALRHPKYILRWSYRAMPNTSRTFVILGVHKHCMPEQYDSNKWCIAIQDTINHAIYFIGERGLGPI